MFEDPRDKVVGKDNSGSKGTGPGSPNPLHTFTEDEVENYRLYIDLLQRQLQKAKETVKTQSIELSKIGSLERERDRYRATVLSLAHQNKLLQQELNQSRRGLSGKEERYVDARLQVQDLREALRIKEMEVEELKEARDHLPTSDAELLAGYQRMREVFDNLRSTLSCSLCYEVFKPNDVLSLECGHSMCRECLKKWSDTHVRLYNLATTPDCPECRVPGRHYVKVYLLEEVVRTVDRLDRLEAAHETALNEARKSQLNGRQGASESPREHEEEPNLVSTPPPPAVLERERARYRVQPTSPESS